MALTETQKKVAALVKEGKKPSEIATILDTSTNNVYQHLRRMRDAKGGAKPKAPAKGKTAAKKTPAAAKATPAVTATTGQMKALRPLTPLQSIRARRDEINADIKVFAAERDSAVRAADKAREALDKITARHVGELGSLDAAEAALTGKPVAGTPVIEPVAPAPAPTGKAPTPPRPKTGAKAGSKPGGKNGSSATNRPKPTSEAPPPPAAPHAPPAPTPAVNTEGPLLPDAPVPVA